MVVITISNGDDVDADSKRARGSGDQLMDSESMRPLEADYLVRPE